MALAAANQYECRTGGSDTSNGGGFNPANANMAADGAATSATGNSAVFTSASYNFVAGDVGAWLFIKSGTNWNPGWYQIASVSSNAATLSSAIGQGVVYPGAFLTTNGGLMVPATVAGVATTASPTSATWSVDYSQQSAAQFTYTDLVSVTTTTITSAAFPFGKNQVGNLIRITSGTTWTLQVLEIVSVTTVTATVDKTVGGTGLTGGNGGQGGAFKGPQVPNTIAVAGNTIWIASGAYTISSTTSNVTLGRITAVANTLIEGYGSLRGDMGTKPVFTASGIASTTLITAAGSTEIRNVTFDCASLSVVNGVSATAADWFYSCLVKNSSTGYTGGNLYSCAADTASIGFAGVAVRSYCVAKTCTAGFSSPVADHCIAMNCTTGFTITGGGDCYHCTAYNSTNSFVMSSGSGGTFFRCVSSTASSRGFDMNTGAGMMIQCAAYLSTTADVRYNSTGTVTTKNIGFISLSADPFTNASGGDFSLNNNGGGGTSLRGLSLAFPTTISTTAYPDVGAVQHQDVTKPTVSYTF